MALDSLIVETGIQIHDLSLATEIKNDDYVVISKKISDEDYLTQKAYFQTAADIISSGVYNTISSSFETISTVMSSIIEKIPDPIIEPGNELADKFFVSSEISSNIPYFAGMISSVHDFPTASATNNDYVFLQEFNSLNMASSYSMYTFDSQTGNWTSCCQFQNYPITENQWKTINSGIQSSDISVLSEYETEIFRFYVEGETEPVTYEIVIKKQSS